MCLSSKIAHNSRRGILSQSCKQKKKNQPKTEKPNQNSKENKTLHTQRTSLHTPSHTPTLPPTMLEFYKHLFLQLKLHMIAASNFSLSLNQVMIKSICLLRKTQNLREDFHKTACSRAPSSSRNSYNSFFYTVQERQCFAGSLNVLWEKCDLRSNNPSPVSVLLLLPGKQYPRSRRRSRQKKTLSWDLFLQYYGTHQHMQLSSNVSKTSPMSCTNKRKDKLSPLGVK